MISIFNVKKLNEYIDKIITGEKDDKVYNNSASEEESTYNDDGINKVVKNLSELDFSSMSKVKDKLKGHLLNRIASKNGEMRDNDEDYELDMNDLDYVAGGLSTDFNLTDEDKQE